MSAVHKLVTGVGCRAAGKAEAEEGPMKTVLIYVNTSAEVGDVDHLKVFANEEAAEKWFRQTMPKASRLSIR
jgi:hypothetical protein